MALPPDIRVNVRAPFPALVQQSGPITITKANGIWTVGFSITAFASVNPPTANYPTDYALCWDDVAKTFFKVSLQNLSQAIQGARNQRLVTTSPIAIGGPDEIINVNISAVAPTCALPAAATRNGVPLTFKDVGGNFAAHNLTITPNGAETIDGLASLVLNVNRQGVTLVPANDGFSTGWSIE